MHLKKLEIQGFKSFANKVSLEFENGITAVVGPNGSGKSNISDAVRWVLGEQSAKNLRGGKMEDVIFAGTQNRKALGFAEVSLFLKEESKEKAGDLTDIRITRKVYRSGESEYFINNQSCRLKDIYELFMDTGIGKEGYSIIGQGKIDEILSSKSEERRNIFEEAAGIVKYKTRKNEAQKKLEKEKENLVRINDIVLELERIMGPLHKQSEEAKKYLGFKEELKKYEVNMFILQVEQIKEILTQYEESIHEIQNELNHFTKMKETTAEIVQKNKKELTNLEEIYQGFQNDIFSYKNNIQKFHSNIQLAEQKREHIKQNTQRIEKELKNLIKSKEGLMEKQSIHEAKFNGIQIQSKSKENELKELEKNHEEYVSYLQEEEEKLESSKVEVIEKLNKISELKVQLQKSKSLYEEIIKRKDKIKEEIHLSEQEEIKIGYKQKQLYGEIEKCKNEITEVSLQISIMQENKKTLSLQVTNSKKIHNEVKEKYTNKTSRRNLLVEMQNDFEGYNKSVKNILKYKTSHHPDFDGICGVIAELIQVPQGYETAIEIALGGSLQNIVTENELATKKTIDFMKKNQLGRATFLPITTVQEKNLGKEKSEILSFPGVKGIAAEIIEFDSLYSGVIGNLLGRVVIVENLEIGIQLAKKYHHTFKIVSLDGDVVHSGGSMTGGSIQNKSSSIFGRKREIEILEEELEMDKKELDSLKDQIDQLEIKQKENDIKWEEKNRLYHDFMLSMQQLESELKIGLKETRELELKKENIIIEEKHLNQQYEKVTVEINTKSMQLKEMEEEIEKIQEFIQQIQSMVGNDKEKRDTFSKKLTDCKIEISSLQKEKEHIENNIIRLKEEISTLKGSELDKNAEIKDFEKESLRLISSIEEFKTNISIENQNLKDSEKSLQNILLDKKKTTEEIQRKEKELDNVASQISVLQQQIYDLNTKKNKVEIEEESLFNKMWEEYEITYSLATGYKNELGNKQQLHKKITELKNEIKKIENVNIGAIEEYKNVKERFTFLSTQREDILKAEKSLESIIEEMTELMKKQFAEKFNLIAEKFDEVFKELFGGGKAQLILENEEDILNSGIEIHVQPPGKKLQTLSLLSGGERALTAISILFAILKIKPAPFCILDEIEAALDDANVVRYAEYLRKFSSETQFIVVTHRKGTMEVADVLYGVTMEEQGVSKVLSVSLNEAVK